jgi:glutamate synthase domain-containing protein 1
MKKLFAISLFLLLAVTSAFAHAGHIHTYMGNVTMLHGDNAFMMKTTDGKDLTIETSEKTSWLHSDNHAAKKSELAVGTRVVVKMSMDGKTATSVKMSAPAKKK